MGCVSSTTRPVAKPRVQHRPIAQQPSTARLADNRVKQAYVHPATAAFKTVTSGVRLLRCPVGMVPPLCIGPDTIPVALSTLYLGGSGSVDVYLPVASIHYAPESKIICFAHVQMLSPVCFDDDDTLRFMLNCLGYLDRGNLKPNVCLYQFPERYETEASMSIDHAGIPVRKLSEATDLTEFDIVLITTLVDFSDERTCEMFRKFLESGGGLACFYCPSANNYDNNADIPANKFLADYGLGYAHCTLSTNGNSRISVQVPPNVDSLIHCTLEDLSESYVKLIEGKEVDPAKLDDIVTALRYHVVLLDERAQDIPVMLEKASWAYLERTGYRTDDGIASDVSQSIVIVLMSDIMPKIPVERVQVSPEAERFPGLCHSCTMETHNLSIRLHDEAWISTGLWINAGVVGTVVCENPPKGVHIQIGSHTDFLLVKQGPWKRWPVVVSQFPMQDGETKIANAYGGIVYVYLTKEGDGDEAEVEEPPKISVSFNGFSKYPRAIFQKPEVWEKTKDFDAPWGELSSKSLIFTMPADVLRRIEDVNQLCTDLDGIVEKISNFMSYQVVRPFRVVFDLQKEQDGPECGYPIVLTMDDIDGIIFDMHRPSPGFFKLLRSLALVSLREGCFDDLTETALATFVAVLMFRELYSTFDIFSMDGIEKPVLFDELWLIHTQVDNTVIRQVLANSQRPEYEPNCVPEDLWVWFVRDLCNISKVNVAKILTRVRPIPISLARPMGDLPSPHVLNL